MMRERHVKTFYMALVLAFALPAGTGFAMQIPDRPPSAEARRVATSFTEASLHFEPNLGQAHKQVRFLSRGHGYTFFLTSSEAVLSLQSPSGDSGKRTDVRFRLVGADVNARIEGVDELPGKINYFIGGNPDAWRRGIPTYAKVRYQNVYPGTDLIYYGNQKQLEYDFVVQPGADPRKIRLSFDGLGATKLAEGRINSDGDLVLKAGEKEVRLQRPHLYQEIDAVRKTISGGYTAVRHEHGTLSVAFQIGTYDLTKPLIIDPVLDYSTYLGGTGDEFARGMDWDPYHNHVYVTGTTTSAIDFPSPGGKAPKLVPTIPDQQNGSTYSFLAKLDLKTGALLYATYFDGMATAMTVIEFSNAAGPSVVVVGAGSPTVPGLTKIGPLGGGDAFALWVDPNGVPKGGTVFGGTNKDLAFGVSSTLYSDTVVYITGTTYSKDFPTKNTQVQTNFGGGASPQSADGINRDAFVVKLDLSQITPDAQLLYGTYLGGSSSDDGFAIKGWGIDAFVTGQTCSNDFPKSFSDQVAFQTENHGGCDAFVASLWTPNNEAVRLFYRTYLGGSGWEVGRSISFVPNLKFIVTGETYSTDFPTQNPAQAQSGGGYDAFVAVLNSGDAPVNQCFIASLKYNNCGDLHYSTYLGGKGNEYGYAVTTEDEVVADIIYVVGQTCPLNASDNSFPQINSLPKDKNIHQNDGTNCDAFLTRIKPSGQFSYSTYLGGSQEDSAAGVLRVFFGDVVVAGTTKSSNFPSGLPSPGGGADAFVSRLSKVCGGGGAYAYFPPAVIDTASDCPVFSNGFVNPKGDYSIAVRPDGGRLFVAINQTVSFVDLDSSGKMIKVNTIAIPGAQQLEGIAISPDSTKLYVLDHKNFDASIYVFDADADQQIGTIKYGDANSDVSGGPLVVHPDGKRLFVGSYEGAKVFVIDLVSKTAKAIDTKVSASAHISGIAVTPDGKSVYVANPGDSTVSIIDASAPGFELWDKNVFVGPVHTVAITPSKVPPYGYLVYTAGAVIDSASKNIIPGKVGGDYGGLTLDRKGYFHDDIRVKVIQLATDEWIDSLFPTLSTYPKAIFGSFIGPQDRDSDGINDEVDGTYLAMFLPNTNFSNDFTDQHLPNGTSFGTIIDRGGPNGRVVIWRGFPTGFYARVSGGDHDARILACNKEVGISQGLVQFICGSLTLKVIGGQAKVDLGGGIFAEVPSGGSVKVSDVSSDVSRVDNLGNTPITIVDAQGQSVSLSPGQSYTTAQAPRVTCTSTGPFTYNGQPQGVTCTANASGSWSYSYTPGGSTAPVNAGTYTLTANFTSSDVHYTNASVTLAITINKTPLTITAANASKLFGAPNPTFTASYSGFVAGEGPQVLSGTLTFSTRATDSSPVGTYPITPGGVTSPNYAITFVNGTLTITYNVCLLYDSTRPVNSGATLPIKLQLCSATGANQSASTIVLTAQQVTQVSTNVSSAPVAAGNANPNQTFRFDPTLGPGYIYNLKTDGLAAGAYNLTFAVTNDPLAHSVPFQVR